MADAADYFPNPEEFKAIKMLMTEEWKKAEKETTIDELLDRGCHYEYGENLAALDTVIANLVALRKRLSG